MITLHEQLLYTFRPSDRVRLLALMEDEQECDQIYEDFVEYITVWEKADWLDDYAIERIANWFRLNAPQPLVDRLIIYAEECATNVKAALLKGLAL